MYLPRHFVEDRVDILHAAIREAGLATLVTSGDQGLQVSHIPMVLDAEPAPLGRLLGHVARGNPQWRSTPAGSEVIVAFVGPDAYVTPSWYPTKPTTGRVVPTWDYVAVHAHGTVRFFEDRERLLDVVGRLTDHHEKGRHGPWKVSDAPADYLDGLLRRIVGVELVITHLEGKWKANQDDAPEERRGVEEGFRREGHDAMADVVRDRSRTA